MITKKISIVKWRKILFTVMGFAHTFGPSFWKKFKLWESSVRPSVFSHRNSVYVRCSQGTKVYRVPYLYYPGCWKVGWYRIYSTLDGPGGEEWARYIQMNYYAWKMQASMFFTSMTIGATSKTALPIYPIYRKNGPIGLNWQIWL